MNASEDSTVTAASASPDSRNETSEKTGLRRRAARGVVWSVGQILGIQGSSFVVFLVLGRILAPKDFGLAATALVVIQSMRVIVDAGFGNALIQLPELSPEDPDTAFWTALAIGTVFLVLTCLLSPVIAILFHEPRLERIVQALSVIFIFVAFDSTQMALQNREMQFRAQTIRRLVATFVSAALAVSLAIAGLGVWALVVQQITLEGLSVFLLWRLTTWRPHLRFSRISFVEMFGFGWRYSVMRILWFLSGNVDNLLIGAFLGPTALGYYAIAFRVLTIFNQLMVVPINLVATPLFARLQSDSDAVNRALCRVSRLSALLGFPTFGAMIVLAGPMIVFLFGAKWGPSGPVLAILAVVGIMQTQTSFIPSYMMAIGRIHNEMKWLCGVVAVQVLAFAVAVHWGIQAVAAAAAIVSVAALPARLVSLRRMAGLSAGQYFDRYPNIAAATALMAIGLLGVRAYLPAMPLVLKLTIEVALGACVYPPLVWLLARDVFREALGLVADLRSRRAS